MRKAKTTPTLQRMQANAGKAEALLKQLANASRLVALCSLVEGEKTVSDLAEKAGLSQSALSQHLSKLREAGLVESEKRGQMVYYSICSMEVQALLSVLHLMFCKE